MAMASAFLAAHGKKLVGIAIALVVLLPVANGVVGGGKTTFVAVEAPQSAANVTIVVGQEPGLLGSCPESAEVGIVRDEIPVYPSALGEIEMDDCRGSIEIPYQRFADRNGPYVAEVEMGGETTETVFNVEKVVNWVYIRSFPNASEERTRVEVALSRAQAHPIQSSVFTSGELELDIYWETCEDEGPLGTGLGLTNETEDCQAEHDNVFHGTVPLNSTAVTNVIVPWDNFESDKYDDGRPAEGYYNVTATFHNAEARANENVPMDPTVYNEDPPGNWFEVEYE